MGRALSPVRRDLVASCVDGASFCVMVGAGETYFAAFALALGIDKVTAGLVSTVPMVFGALAQLASPRAVSRIGSNARWVVAAGHVQSAMFLPLIVAALLGSIPTVALFAVLAAYFGAGFAGGPAWATWIETLVPKRVTSRYFARRGLWAYAALLTALLASGALLEAGEAHGAQFGVFACLFAVAGAARFVSARALASQREPVPQPPGRRHVGVVEVLRRMRHAPQGRLLVFLLSLTAAIQVAQPFLTSYFRAQLRLPYVGFAVLMAVPYVARIAAFPLLGALAHRTGPRTVMWIGVLALVPAAGLLVVSSNVVWIGAVQFVAGVGFAAVELANLLLWFEAIGPEERTSVLTTYNLCWAVSVVTGSLCGSAILNSAGEGPHAFLVVFAVSAALRLVAAGLFLRTKPVLTNETASFTTEARRPTEADSQDSERLASSPSSGADRATPDA